MDSKSKSIHLNLVHIGSKLCKSSLIIYTICIWLNFEKIQGTFFVIFAEADDSRLQNYEITKFTAFVRSGGGSGGGVGGGGGVFKLTFKPKLNKCK